MLSRTTSFLNSNAHQVLELIFSQEHSITLLSQFIRTDFSFDWSSSLWSMRKVDISVTFAASEPNAISLSTNYYYYYYCFFASNSLDPMAASSWKLDPYSVSEHTVWELIISLAEKLSHMCELPGPPHLTCFYFFMVGTILCAHWWDPRCTGCASAHINLVHYGGFSDRFLFHLLFFPQKLLDSQQTSPTQKEFICHSHSSSKEPHHSPRTLKILLRFKGIFFLPFEA